MSYIVALCIPTYKRPKYLLKLLKSIAKIDFDGELSIFVVDNDAQKQEGKATCEAVVKDGYRWPLTCEIELRPGISYVRNSAAGLGLNLPNVQFIAMVDDDEFVEPQWLKELLSVQQITQADIVGGPVLPFVEDGKLPDWAIKGQFFERPRHKDGIVDIINGSGNILISAPTLLQYMPEVFPEIFAISGGSDADFFYKMKSDNKIFAWANNAISHEILPLTRVTKKWLRQRAFRTGNTNVAIQRRYQRGILQEIKRLIKTAGLLVFSIFYFLITWPLELHRLKSSILFYKGLGKVKGHCGSLYLEYKVIHGS